MALEKYEEVMDAAEDAVAMLNFEEIERVRLKVMFPDGSMHEIDSVSLAEYRDGGGTDRVLWLKVER